MKWQRIAVLLVTSCAAVAVFSGVGGSATTKLSPYVRCQKQIGGGILYNYKWPTPAAPSKPLTIYVLRVHEDDPGALTIRDSLVSTLKQLRNVTVKNFVAGGYDKPDVQLNQVDLAVNDPKTSGIIIWSVDPKVVLPHLKKAFAKGIPVVGLLEPLKDRRVVNTIYDDSTGIAERLMDSLIAKIGGKGKVATILGIAGSTTHANFVTGTRRSVAKHPGVTLVAQREYVGVDPAKTQTLAEEVLRKNPDVKGILTIVGQEAQGASRAIAGAGLKGKVAIASWAITGPADVEQIASGTQDLALGVPLVVWTHVAVWNVIRAAEKKPVAKWVAPPGQLYTPGDVLKADLTADLLPKYLGKYGKSRKVC